MTDSPFAESINPLESTYKQNPYWEVHDTQKPVVLSTVFRDDSTQATGDDADSNANEPVASPGPRIHVGVLRSSGAILYRVATLGHAYINRDMVTVPSVNSSYVDVCDQAS